MSEYKVPEVFSFQKLAYFLLLSFCLFYAFNMLKAEAGKMHPAGSYAAGQPLCFSLRTDTAGSRSERKPAITCRLSFYQSPSQITSFSVRLSVDITIISNSGLMH